MILIRTGLDALVDLDSLLYNTVNLKKCNTFIEYLDKLITFDDNVVLTNTWVDKKHNLTEQELSILYNFISQKQGFIYYVGSEDTQYVKDNFDIDTSVIVDNLYFAQTFIPIVTRDIKKGGI